MLPRQLFLATCGTCALCAAPTARAASELGALTSASRPEAAALSERTLTLAPSPDQPCFGLSFRDGTRGQLGAALPLVGVRGRSRVALVLPALVELSNAGHADSQLPNESWRARIGLEAWTTLFASTRREVSLGLALEHESDHETSRWASSLDFYSLNDVALRGAHAFRLGFADLTLATDARLFVFSCSRAGACGGLHGSASTGAEAAAVLDFSPIAYFAGFAPYIAADAGAIAAHGDLRGEARAVGHLGVWTRGARESRWSVFLLALVGNDVGITRTERVHQLGAGVRWAP